MTAKFNYCFLLFATALITACSGGGGGAKLIDDMFGGAGLTPILTSIQDRTISQGDQLLVDVNNIMEGNPGTDEGMSYSCYYDREPSGVVGDTNLCTALPNSDISFDAATGVLLWKPNSGVLGNYEFRITGTGKNGTYDEIFTLGVRLKFSGISQYTSISGTTVTMTWTPNPEATAYQIFKLNTVTGQFEFHQTVSDPNATGTTLINLSPNTAYTFRVHALDVLGFLDNNVTSRSVTTTELVRLSMSSSSAPAPAGSPVALTVQAYNADGSPQTIGGLPVNLSVTSGSSVGSFSAVVDNNNGTYTAQYTPTVVGTPIEIEASINISYFLMNKVSLTVIAGPPSNANSAISVASNTVVSAESVGITAQVKDAFGNPLPNANVIFKKLGGTSTGTIGTTHNAGNGIYTSTYSGIVAGTPQSLQIEVNGTTLSTSTNITVVPGPASSLTSTVTISSSSIASGTSALITAHLRDSNSNSIPSGVFVSFNKSGGTATGNLAPINNNGGGIYTTTYTGINAGLAQTITAVVDGIALTPTVTVAVVPNVPTLANSSLTTTNNIVTSGQFVTLVATLRDLNNNPVESGHIITPTKTGGTSSGNFSTVTNQGNGTYSFRYSGVISGTAQTVGVNVDGNPLGHTQAITVIPGSPSPTLSTLSVSNGSISSGSSSSITAILRDDSSNLIPSGHTVTFTKSGGTSSGILSAAVNAGGGTYTSTYTGENAGSAQTLSISVNGIPLGPTASIAVTAGAPSNSLTTFTVSTDQLVAGSSSTVTITLRDAYSNPISGGVLVGIQSLGGSSSGTLSSVTNSGGGVYTATFTGTVVGTPLVFQATANGSGIGPTKSIQVLVGAPVAANSTLTVTSSPVASGNMAVIAATIRDAHNNLINSEYSITFDTILGSSSGTLSSLTHLGNGQHQIQYQALMAGTPQTVRVLAEGTPIAGLTQPIQVIAGAVSPANSIFTVSSTTVQSGTVANLNMNLRDANDNPINGATVTFNKSASTSNGNLSSPATFSSGGNYTATYAATTQGTPQTISLIINGVSTSALSITLTVIAGPPDHLALTGTTTGLNAIDCHGPFAVTLKDSVNNTTSSLTDLVVELKSQTTNVFSNLLFEDSNCNNNIAELNFSSGTSVRNFYFKSFQPINSNLILDAPNGITDSTVGYSVIPVLSWLGTAATATMNGSGTAVVASDGAAGALEPFDVHIDGDYMFVADFTGNRILKYNITTNTYEGWIGHIGEKEGISLNCSGSVAGDITPGWCIGGRSQNSTTPTILSAPRGFGSDSVYLYIAAGHRILRFLISTGEFQGWIGRIASTTGMTPPSCVSAGVGAATPTWCYGGTTAANAAEGSFNTPSDIVVFNNKIYITDTSNHRIQRWTTSGSYEAWVGRINNTTSLAPTACANAGAGAATPVWCTGGTSQISNRRGLTNFNATTPDPTPIEGFNNPRAITTDGTYLYIGDSSNYRILRINITSGAYSGWIGRLHQSTGAAGIYPTSPVHTTTGGNVYPTSWIQGGGSYESSSTTGFGAPYGLDYADGKLYIADASYNRVIKIDANDGQNFEWIGRVNASPSGGAIGCSSTSPLNPTPGWCRGGTSYVRGAGNGSFNGSYGVAISGNSLYAVDRLNYRVQKFNRTTGAFERWIGSQQLVASTWHRTQPSAAARAGFDNYSFGLTVGAWNGITVDQDNLFVTDTTGHRIKRHAAVNGALIGYIGQLDGSVAGAGSGYSATAPEACTSNTTGMTPDWCTGGGRPTTGTGVHGYNQPRGVASDGTYIYIANLSNNRIDRVRISDAIYLGWTGQVGTTPTDGDTNCTSTYSPDLTPGWCINGGASATSAFGSFDAPRGIYYDRPENKLYVTDTRRIIRINSTTGTTEGVIGHITTAGAGCSSNGTIAFSWCGSGALASAGTNRYGGVNNPTGIATNTTYIFASDTGTHRILRFNKSTGAPAGFVAQLAAITALVTNAGDLCNGLAAPFPKSTPGWCTGSYTADLNTSAGAGNNAFNTPSGLWADETYVYISDSGNNRIVRINANTGVFEGWKGVIGSTGGMLDATCVSAGVGNVTPKWCDNGTAMASQKLGGFYYPTGIYGDANYLYVQDSMNNRIVTIPRN